MVLCTDDSGVFQTSLSQEYAIATQAFGLSEADLWKLVIDSVDYTFLSDAARRDLKQLILSRKDALNAL